jgi:hypothetical protein
MSKDGWFLTTISNNAMSFKQLAIGTWNNEDIGMVVERAA